MFQRLSIPRVTNPDAQLHFTRERLIVTAKILEGYCFPAAVEKINRDVSEAIGRVNCIRTTYRDLCTLLAIGFARRESGRYLASTWTVVPTDASTLALAVGAVTLLAEGCPVLRLPRSPSTRHEVVLVRDGEVVEVLCGNLSLQVAEVVAEGVNAQAGLDGVAVARAIPKRVA